jgi:hypothetical protein
MARQGRNKSGAVEYEGVGESTGPCFVSRNSSRSRGSNAPCCVCKPLPQCAGVLSDFALVVGKTKLNGERTRRLSSAR